MSVVDNKKLEEMLIMDDRSNITKVFRLLRKEGFEAKQRLDWSKATQEQEESKNILWVDTEHLSREKGFENYMEDGTLNRDLHISWSLTDDKIDKAYDIMNQFGLEVIKPTSEWQPFIIKQKVKLIKDLEYYRYMLLKIKSLGIDDGYSSKFIELGEKQVNNRNMDCYYSTISNTRFQYKYQYDADIYETWQSEWRMELKKLEDGVKNV